MKTLLDNILIKRLLLTFQFMTRIPVPISIDIQDDDIANGMIFFPIVGIVLGGIIVLAAYLTGLWTNSVLCQSIVAVLAGVLATGGLHLDGFVDVCDGVFSARGRERTFEIMKDSHIGAFGSAGLFFNLALRFALIASIIMQKPDYALRILATMPIIGRAGILIASYLGKSARPGMGRNYIEGMNLSILSIGVGVSLILMLLFLGIDALWALIVIALVVFALVAYFDKKLGGLTGDCLGCINEVCEIVFLFIAVSTLFGGAYVIGA